MFKTFVRTWWKDNPNWPNGLEPDAGKKKYHGLYRSQQEAIAACREYNDSHEPGRYSRKMEFEGEGGEL